MSTWSRVNGINTQSSTTTNSIAVTLTWSATAGNKLVVALGQNAGSTSGLSVSDNGSPANTWSAVDSESHSNQCTVWATTVTTGGELTITATLTTAAKACLFVDEFTSATGVGATESAVAAGSSSTSASPGTVTPTGTDLIYAAFMSYGNLGTVSVSSPFSLAQTASTNNEAGGATAFAADQTSAQTPTFSFAGGGNWASVGFGVKAASAAVFVPFHQLFRGLNHSLMDTP